MKQIEPDLWQTSRRTITEDVFTHAYLLTRPSGNLLLYGIGEGQDHDLDAIDALGGVAVQILSHHDEAGPALTTIRSRFGSRLACSELEIPSVREYAEPDLTVDSNSVVPALDGLEILDTPGHSNGSISFRYASPYGKTYLFTGDTILPSGDGWQTFVVEDYGGSAESLIDSLHLLRAQEPDLVISSAYVGATGVKEMNSEQWAEIVDHRIERLRARFMAEA